MSASQEDIQEEQNYTVTSFPSGSPQKEFVNDLKKIYVTYKKCQGLFVMLTDCFEKSPDPFFASLSIAFNSFDYLQSKLSSLTYTVLEVFTSWAKPRMDSIAHLLTENIKLNAFKVASGQKNRAITMLIVNTYQMKESNSCFISEIRQLLEIHRYKEACELVKILNLENNFNIYDFLVPLFFQDKLVVIDEYLADNTNDQIAFLKFLDSLVVENNLSNKISIMISELKMPEIPVNILCKLCNIKALTRYIKRLVSDFKLSKDIVPNFSKRSEYKTVSYLVHKRFGDKSLTEESFRELVVDLVKGNEEVAKEFLAKLSHIGASSEVVYWCQVLNVPITNMPKHVQDYYENMSKDGEAVEDDFKYDDWEELSMEEFHTLSLPQSAIIFVSNESELLSMLNSEFISGIPPSRSSKNFPQQSEVKNSKKNNNLAQDNLPCGVTSNPVADVGAPGKVCLGSLKEGIADNVGSKVLETSLERPSQTINTVTDEAGGAAGALNHTSGSPVADKEQKSCQETCVSTVPVNSSSISTQACNRSLLASGGASLISGAASLVSGGASIVSGGVSLVSGTASLVCSGASVVSGGASLVSSGVSLVTGRASLVSAGASLASGSASLVSGGSSLVSSGVSLVSGTASVVSGGVNLVSGGASLVSGAAALVAGGVTRMAGSSTQTGAPPAVEGPSQSPSANVSFIPKLEDSLIGPGGTYVVALDCEWKPSSVRGKTGLSLLQLSTPNSVYIMDLISLTSCQQHWDQIISNLFNNPDILKLGFSLQTDMLYLSSYFDCDYVNFGCNLLDLADLWFKLSNDYNFKFPYSDKSQDNSNSLSKLVYLCLGKKLDKKETFSNWELRPLRESQIQYAALDSFCLIEIYNVLKYLCTERGLPFDDIVYDVVQKYNEKIAKKKKRQEEKFHGSVVKEKEIQVLNEHPISVDCISLICDKMVTGLAKKFRRCGISTDVIDPKASTEEIIRKALTENKVILVKGLSYNKMKEAMPPNMVYKIKTWNPDCQFIEVLNYFNFAIRNEDIFSRCLDCNSVHMLKCTQEEVEAWHVNPLREVSLQPSIVPAGYEEETFQDECDNFCEDYDSDYGPFNKERLCKPVTTKYGCPIKTDVPESVRRRINTYHLCESCGKIYWNEGQFDQILGTFNSSFISP